jgi:hypothetical protein
MAREHSGAGFGWGLLIGGTLGLVGGAFLASGPGREQVDSLRSRTIELSSGGEKLKAQARAAAGRARDALQDAENPVGRAVQEGLTAARRRREELAAEGPPQPGAED